MSKAFLLELSRCISSAPAQRRRELLRTLDCWRLTNECIGERDVVEALEEGLIEEIGCRDDMEHVH